MFQAHRAKNWVYHDPISNRCYVWVKPFGTVDFSKNCLYRPDFKQKIEAIDMADYERVPSALIVAELHAFLKIKEVRSLFVDAEGAEPYLTTVRE